MQPQLRQSVSLLNTTTMPFTSNVMTDFYLQLYIRDLVANNSIVLSAPNSGASTEEVVNVLLIHTTVNVQKSASETTCVDVCGYHSKVDVSDITKIRNQYVLYTVVPILATPCAACSKFFFLGNMVHMSSSHELQELLVNEALGDLKDPTKLEVADICAVIIWDKSINFHYY
jgi:hypothetical protein